MSPNSITVLFAAILASSAFHSVHARGLLQEGEGGQAQVGGIVPLDQLGCVRINEVVHKPAKVNDVKGVDYVELINVCEQNVNLAGWSIADEKENTFTMGQDSCEHTIQGFGGKLVFFRKNGCSFQFGFGGVDQATLRDETTNIVDQVKWGKENANKGYSWSRIPDGNGNFQDGLPTAGGNNAAA